MKKMIFFSELLVLESNLLTSLFFTELQERFSHGRSFVMSDLSELLMVALLLRVMRAIVSRSLPLKSDESKLLTVAQ